MLRNDYRRDKWIWLPRFKSWTRWFAFRIMLLWKLVTVLTVFNCLIDWFWGISTRLGLFYAKRLENRAHCTFIFRHFVSLSFKRFLHTVTWYQFGWLVGFNGISTSIGYLMSEHFYTYIICMICKCKCLGWWWLGFMANWPFKGHWVLNSDVYVCVYI